MSCPSAPNFSIHSHQMHFSHLHVWDFVTCRPVSSRNSLHIMGYLDMFLNFCDSWLERSATKESHESTGQLRSVACKFHFFASNSSLTIAFFQPSASTSDSHLQAVVTSLRDTNANVGYLFGYQAVWCQHLSSCQIRPWPSCRCWDKKQVVQRRKGCDTLGRTFIYTPEV